MGRILREIQGAFTRYSANALEFPVNDRVLFTGCEGVAAGAGLEGVRQPCRKWTYNGSVDQ
jgi:hypothetical protein